MLCTHKTTTLCQDGSFVTSLPTHISVNSQPFLVGIVSGQVSLDNTRTHAITYINTPAWDAQDNDMFYYCLADSLMNDFHTTVLLYADIYTFTNVPVASMLLKQIIILTRVDNPASTMHITETDAPHGQHHGIQSLGTKADGSPSCVRTRSG